LYFDPQVPYAGAVRIIVGVHFEFARTEFLQGVLECPAAAVRFANSGPAIPGVDVFTSARLDFAHAIGAMRKTVNLTDLKDTKRLGVAHQIRL
jgi:hypothetical protein